MFPKYVQILIQIFILLKLFLYKFKNNLIIMLTNKLWNVVNEAKKNMKNRGYLVVNFLYIFVIR